MSQENVEIVRRAIAYEYDGVGDRAEAVAEAIFDRQVVMNPTRRGGLVRLRCDASRLRAVGEDAFDELDGDGQGNHRRRGSKSSWSRITRG